MTDMDIDWCLFQLQRLRGGNQTNALSPQDKLLLDKIGEFLYAHCLPDFRRVAGQVGLNTQDFDDVCQETFRRIVAMIETYSYSRRTGRAWIATIFRNGCRDSIKRDIRLGKMEEDINSIEEPWSDTEDPVNIVQENEQQMALRCALADLTEEEREQLRHPGRGPGRREWHRVVGRLRALFQHYYHHQPAME